MLETGHNYDVVAVQGFSHYQIHDGASFLLITNKTKPDSVFLRLVFNIPELNTGTDYRLWYTKV